MDDSIDDQYVEHFYLQYLKRRFGVNSCASLTDGELLYNLRLTQLYTLQTNRDNASYNASLTPGVPVYHAPVNNGSISIPVIIPSTGISGSSSGNTYTGIAGENLTAGKLVYILQDKFYTYDGTNEHLADILFGIAIETVLANDEVHVQFGDIFTQVGLGLISGQTYFAAAGGSLTQTPSSVSTLVGIAVNPDSIKIEIQQSIILVD